VRHLADEFISDKDMWLIHVEFIRMSQKQDLVSLMQRNEKKCNPFLRMNWR
jgi:hypothetical protein